ncbi:MAG: hypothetical protein IKO55_14790, partial [Kiritimatiellae bacterium]|nr:hypothetical protein [Kiritimatiellia bacterium]
GDYANVSNKAVNSVQKSELSSLETDPTVPSWAKAANKPSYTASEVGAATSSDLATIAGMLNAENARFGSTNYNSATQIPSAYVEAKIDGSWIEIWNELTRWNWLTSEYLPTNFYTKGQINSALEDKADRAWGFYDPMTGEWAPEDSIWLSAPKVYVCAGGAYERVAETTGYWVLTSNGMVANINGTTNGFFRISDSSNETQFEIVKGDKRTLFAHATSMQPVMGVNHYLTTYAITNAVSEPTANFARALGANEQSWHHTDPSCPFNASWNQTSANEWTLEWWPKSSEPTAFLESFYERGGETYIRNVAPISVEGGILCTDGIHKVRPVYNNGSITWEVVQ